MDKARLIELTQQAALRPVVLFKKGIFMTGVIVWLGIAMISGYFFYMLESLPSESSLSLNSVKESSIQRLKQRYESPKKRAPQWTPLRDVHRDLLYAIVLSEDGRFFSHSGIDYDALIAAFAENIKSEQWRFGASTISQQTAKNVYLNNGKTLSRKFQELIITKRLENSLSKNEILEVYLNIIEFGPDIYGIHDACQYYFKKSPLEINAAEGAYLALLMPSPRKYHYTLFQNGNWSPALKRKHHRILKDMRYKELISADQYKKYKKWRYENKNSANINSNQIEPSLVSNAGEAPAQSEVALVY